MNDLDNDHHVTFMTFQSLNIRINDLESTFTSLCHVLVTLSCLCQIYIYVAVNDLDNDLQGHCVYCVRSWSILGTGISSLQQCIMAWQNWYFHRQEIGFPANDLEGQG